MLNTIAPIDSLLVDAPTTRRAFGRGDEVTAAVRVYQRRSGTVAQMRFTVR